MIDTILKTYDWFDHPEGSKFVETYRDKYRTSGHWLFLPGSFSSFHRVYNNEEIWSIHIGRLLIHVIDQNGDHQILRLGTDLEKGERPIVTVPTGFLQAAELPERTDFAFGTNICAPAFLYEEFGLASREELIGSYPKHKELIMRLTR